MADHTEGLDQFGKVTCSCGEKFTSRAEQWKHAADALRARAKGAEQRAAANGFLYHWAMKHWEAGDDYHTPAPDALVAEREGGPA